MGVYKDDDGGEADDVNGGCRLRTRMGTRMRKMGAMMRMKLG